MRLTRTAAAVTAIGASLLLTAASAGLPAFAQTETGGQTYEYLEMFEPIFYEGLEGASTIANAAVSGAKLSFPWVGVEEDHYVAVNTDEVITGERSLVMDYDGNSAVMNTVGPLTAPLKFLQEKYYIFNFSFKVLKPLPAGFKMEIHSMTWTSSPNYFFTAVIQYDAAGRLTIDCPLNDSNKEIYKGADGQPLAEPQTAIKDLGGGLYNVAVIFQGAKSADDQENMFLRLAVTGESKLSFDDFAFYAGMPTDLAGNFVRRTEEADYLESFEKAEGVTAGGITGTQITSPGGDMTDQFALTGSAASVIDGKKSLLFSNLETEAVEKLAFGNTQDSFLMQEGEGYKAVLQMLPSSAPEGAFLKLHGRGADGALLFTAAFTHSGGEWTAAVTKTDAYPYDLPEAAIEPYGSKGYNLGVGFTGVAGTYLTVELSGRTTMSLDGLGVYRALVGECVQRYFPVVRHTIRVSGGKNGRVSPVGATEVEKGKDFTLTITPEEGYELDALLLDGVKQEVYTQQYTLSEVDADHTIEVSFKRKQYAVQVEAGENGAIYPNKDVTVPHGGKLTLFVSPNPGYRLDTLFVNGEQMTIEGQTLVVENVTDKVTVYATFREGEAVPGNPTSPDGTDPSEPDNPGTGASWPAASAGFLLLSAGTAALFYRKRS